MNRTFKTLHNLVFNYELDYFIKITKKQLEVNCYTENNLTQEKALRFKLQFNHSLRKEFLDKITKTLSFKLDKETLKKVLDETYTNDDFVYACLKLNSEVMQKYKTKVSLHLSKKELVASFNIDSKQLNLSYLASLQSKSVNDALFNTYTRLSIKDDKLTLTNRKMSLQLDTSFNIDKLSDEQINLINSQFMLIDINALNYISSSSNKDLQLNIYEARGIYYLEISTKDKFNAELKLTQSIITGFEPDANYINFLNKDQINTDNRVNILMTIKTLNSALDKMAELEPNCIIQFKTSVEDTNQHEVTIKAYMNKKVQQAKKQCLVVNSKSVPHENKEINEVEFYIRLSQLRKFLLHLSALGYNQVILNQTIGKEHTSINPTYVLPHVKRYGIATNLLHTNTIAKFYPVYKLRNQVSFEENFAKALEGGDVDIIFAN